MVSYKALNTKDGTKDKYSCIYGTNRHYDVKNV